MSIEIEKYIKIKRVQNRFEMIDFCLIENDQIKS